MTRQPRGARLTILLLLLAPPGPVHAQTGGWALGVMTAYSDFWGGVRQTSGITFEPSSRLEFGVSAMRTFQAWQVEAEVSYAPGHLSSRDSTGKALQIDLIGESFPRLRIAPLIGFRLVAVGEGRLAFKVGPTFDLWHENDKLRPRFGGQARLVLEAPVGGLVLEDYLGYSLSGSPFDESELSPGLTRTTLQAISLGVEIRLRL